MLATLAIYLTAVLLCLGAGVAVRGNLDPSGAWVSAASLPLGFCVVMLVLYALAWAMPMRAAGPLVAGIAVGGLLVAVARRRRAGRASATGPASLGLALRAAGGDTAVVAAGVVGGLLLLLPVLDLGFPTTLAITNNDTWGYASLVEWFREHRLTWSVQPDVEEPLTFPPWTSLSNGFGIGFELFGAAVAGLLGRQGFEVVTVTAAVGAPMAAAGWAALWRAAGGHLSTGTAFVALAVVSPLFVVAFAESFTTQFVSIALWPFAVAGAIGLVRRPGRGTLAVAAIGVAGVIGVYPALLPWLVPTLLVAALIPAERGARAAWWPARLDAAGLRPRLLRAVTVLGVLALTVSVIAPVQVVRAARNVLFVSDGTGNVLFPSLGAKGFGVFGLGAGGPPFPIVAGAPVPAAEQVLAVLLLAVVGLAVGVSLRASSQRRWVLAAAGATPAVATVALVLNYTYADVYPYGVLKALISGGALLAGMLLLALAHPATPRSRPLQLAAVGACVAAWLPVSTQLIEYVADGGTGFRRDDVALGRALRGMPTGSTVLVEGAAEGPGTFQMRLMGAYMGEAFAGLETEGLGSTSSYLTPGGGPEWRPDAPWSHVVANAPSVFEGGRRPLWANASYALAAAPPLDATPYGRGWYPTELAGATPFAWTSGPAEIVVSNRSASARLTLRLRAASHEVPRRLTLTSGRRSATSTISPGRLTEVTFPLMVAPGGTAVVELDASPAATPAPPGDLRLLMARVQSVRVEAAPPPAG